LGAGNSGRGRPTEGTGLGAGKLRQARSGMLDTIEHMFVWSVMALQRSFEDVGTPLSEVTFCIVDLETTGGSPQDSAITEVGAVKVRRGEVLGTFQTLVNPGCPVPAFIRLLTGITDELVASAPPIESVLPSFIEFAGRSVLVAHNARFDVSFLNRALESHSYPRLANRVIDTALLARKTLAGEVPNNKLETLARHLRCAHQPSHRAYTDALATTDLLHHLIERVAGFGVTTLEDLVAISFTRMDQTISKIKLADDLPKAAGVYRFLDGSERTLYVGKASDLRSRVRSYFYGDPRRKIRNLLKETQSVAVEVHKTMLEAEISEARAIASEIPPYNRAGKSAPKWWLKVTLNPRTARVSAARVVKNDGLYLGPFKALKNVQMLIDALRDTSRLHRCTDPNRCRGCAFFEMNTCVGSDRRRHKEEVRRAATALTYDPGPLMDALERRMQRLAQFERFEEAAELRARASFMERALVGGAEVESLLQAREFVLATHDRVLLFRNGLFVAAQDRGEHAGSTIAGIRSTPSPPGEEHPHSVKLAEARILHRWLRSTEGVRILWVDGTFALPPWARPSERFSPRGEERVRS
jgi:DNA polymerase III subunit epsilon